MRGFGRKSSYQCPCCDWNKQVGRRDVEKRENWLDVLHGDGIDIRDNAVSRIA
nr:MAG TPA: cysteine-rich protein [Caudoviricetes sp.]